MTTGPGPMQMQIDELRAQLWRYAEVNAFLLAQTRFACDCLVQIITRGGLPGIPWHDMDPNHVGDGSSVKAPAKAPAEHIIVPNRAERRKAARDFINRQSNGGQR